MRRTDGNVITEAQPSGTEQLARFFPKVVAQRVPVHVVAQRGRSASLREATVLEFGGAEHGIFQSTLPLEFADRVKIEDSERRGTAGATVVAVQYHEGRKAVAVRFSQPQERWVKQP